jgi:hypothetical protein
MMKTGKKNTIKWLEYTQVNYQTCDLSHETVITS